MNTADMTVSGVIEMAEAHLTAGNSKIVADLLDAERNGKNRTTLVVALQRLLDDVGVGVDETHPAVEPTVPPKVIQVAGEFGPYDQYMEIPTLRGTFGVAPGEVLVVPESRKEPVIYRKA